VRPIALTFVSALVVCEQAACYGAASVVPREQASAKENAMDGLKTVKSAFGPKETMDRLDAAVRNKGMTVFARIDHAAGATDVGLTLRPTELLVFGSAKVGTALMQAKQTMGIDLPLKALVWQDANGTTWLSYDEPQGIVVRHGGDAALAPIADAMTKGLVAMTNAATRPVESPP
jgi:uncharacterized protein (DUF302 family)